MPFDVILGDKKKHILVWKRAIFKDLRGESQKGASETVGTDIEC